MISLVCISVKKTYMPIYTEHYPFVTFPLEWVWGVMNGTKDLVLIGRHWSFLFTFLFATHFCLKSDSPSLEFYTSQ